MQNTLVSNCKQHTNKKWTGCTITLGKVDAKKHGLTQALQLTAGWLNGSGAGGIRNYTTKWVK